jgi:uncharacterized protein
MLSDLNFEAQIRYPLFSAISSKRYREIHPEIKIIHLAQKILSTGTIEKPGVNERKHGVSFEEAQTVFYDENARLRYDSDHSLEEERYILLGISNMLRLLVVCHVCREEQGIIRIISARKATKQEGKQYRGFSL